MKKTFIIIIMSSLLLAACSNDETTNEEFEKELTKEDIVEVIHDLEENAKKEGLVKNIEVNEGDKEVSLFIDFEDKANEDARAQFLFNYLLFLKEKYPDKEVTFTEKE